jgi:hypothetical protein
MHANGNNGIHFSSKLWAVVFVGVFAVQICLQSAIPA